MLDVAWFQKQSIAVVVVVVGAEDPFPSVGVEEHVFAQVYRVEHELPA